MRRSLIALTFALAAGFILPQAAEAGHDGPAPGYYGAGPVLGEVERRVFDDSYHGRYPGDGYDRRDGRGRAYACGHERKFKAHNVREGRSRHCRDLSPGLARYRDDWSDWDDYDSRQPEYAPFPGGYGAYGYDDGYYDDPSGDLAAGMTGLILDAIILSNRDD